jgi:predicted nuclease of predicted toxin-antitoxin system
MMVLWLDAHISPAIAIWINNSFPNMEAKSVKLLGLRDAKDLEIFMAAKQANAVIMSKDTDFQILLMRHGPPPKLIQLTSGNTSNARLKSILAEAMPKCFDMLNGGEQMVEVHDRLK